MAHVIVIGAGLGEIPAAFVLRKHLAKRRRVTLTGARPYFEFTPSNPWIAVGLRTTQKTQVPMQTPLDNKGVDWLANTVTQIDAEHSAPRFQRSTGSGPRRIHAVRLQSGSFGAGLDALPVYESYVLKAIGIVSLKKRAQ
jgi:NADPH-dependent 2,4-dienoyl-CoA reductase/sulfur reductase-like enzyme